MKRIAAALVMTLCSVIAIGQRKLAEDDPQWRQQAVERAFHEVSNGLRTSWSEKYLARLGDSAAPEIMSYLRSRQLTKEDSVTALSLVKMSFANPSSIRHTSSKSQKNTLILLDYLDKHTTDADTKSNIKSVREELQSQSFGAESNRSD
ncbi:MAG TPA: hypothetical protein VMQ17_02860 [Candidatus Sulfotelmatobacter sp.]|nr:hypothetical protein [Candidatus Sulfotelmatobacter sp.]